MAIAASKLINLLFTFTFSFNLFFCLRYPTINNKYEQNTSKGEAKTINPSGNENEMISDLKK